MIPIGAAPLSPNLSRIKKCTVAALAAAAAASIVAVITVLCAPNRITISGRTGDVSTPPPPTPFVLFEFRTAAPPLSVPEPTY